MTPQQRRAYQREYYRLTNPHRYGKRPGPKPGFTYPVEPDDVLRGRIDAFRREKEQERAEGPRSLARTCEFCDHLVCEHGLERQVCERNREPDGSGCCDLWEARYKVETEPEDRMDTQAGDGKGRAA